jgi:hypothetical protein
VTSAVKSSGIAVSSVVIICGNSSMSEVNSSMPAVTICGIEFVSASSSAFSICGIAAQSLSLFAVVPVSAMSQAQSPP